MMQRNLSVLKRTNPLFSMALRTFASGSETATFTLPELEATHRLEGFELPKSKVECSKEDLLRYF